MTPRTAGTVSEPVGHAEAQAVSEVGPREIRVQARTAAVIDVEKGAILEVVDVDGKQVADLVAFVAAGFTEWLSVTHTRSALARTFLLVGDELHSNRRRPLFRIARDDVGVHDLLVAMCDTQRYSQDFGLPDHASCRANLAARFADRGIEAWQIADPLNVFQNSPVDATGHIGSEEPMSVPGSSFALEALEHMVVGVSACPQDQNPCNGWRPSPILLRVTEQPT